MLKPFYIGLGLLMTALAIAGAVLPGLPTTPFLLVALWAFARSSEQLTRWLERIPLLQAALREAHRFEQRRAVRPGIKLTAVGCAWCSVLLTWLAVSSWSSPVLLTVVAAALAATAFMLWIPTDRTPME